MKGISPCNIKTGVRVLNLVDGIYSTSSRFVFGLRLRYHSIGSDCMVPEPACFEDRNSTLKTPLDNFTDSTN
jgi:hypothetical protein